jgi:hypothetical protein
MFAKGWEFDGKQEQAKQRKSQLFMYVCQFSGTKVWHSIIIDQHV